MARAASAEAAVVKAEASAVVVKVAGWWAAVKAKVSAATATAAESASATRAAPLWYRTCEEKGGDARDFLEAAAVRHATEGVGHAQDERGGASRERIHHRPSRQPCRCRWLLHAACGMRHAAAVPCTLTRPCQHKSMGCGRGGGQRVVTGGEVQQERERHFVRRPHLRHQPYSSLKMASPED